MGPDPIAPALALITFQLADTVVTAIPLPQIRESLDRVQCPERLRPVLPVVKAAAAAGLVVGLWQAWVGFVTCVALVLYFVAAIGFHVRARDRLVHTVPAAVMLVVAAAVATTFHPWG